MHQCDYFPTVRNDWETLLGAGVTLKLSPRISLSADLVRHDAWNALPNPSERKFHRFTASVGATCRF